MHAVYAHPPSQVRKASVVLRGYNPLRDPSELDMFDVLRLDSGSSVDTVVRVLLDLTFYEHPELVTAAMGLLVRHFEQRSVLISLARETRLLVKDHMVAMYRHFDTVLRKLHLLAGRRRLFDEEPYQAARLMSILTMLCYEESEGLSGGTRPLTEPHHPWSLRVLTVPGTHCALN
jgi:hypothetical protein